MDIDTQRIDCYRLTNRQYALVTSTIGNQPLQHPDWPELNVDPAEIWK